MDPKRILVIQTAFIGDVILATSMLESLHSAYPSAEIDVLVRKGNESLLGNHPFLHDVLIWDKQKQKSTNLIKIIRTIRSKDYDVIFNAHRFLSSGLICALSGAEKTIGFDKNPLSFTYDQQIRHELDGRHEIERNHELLNAFDESIQLKNPRVYPNASSDKSDRSFVCIAPTSVWFTKQWPAHKWIELIQTFPSELKIFLLGAGSDASACDAIKASCTDHDVENFAGKLSLLESAAMMKKAQMNYVNDSAPMHLASAVDAPVTVVFCSTIPHFGFGPLSTSKKVVETPEALDCRPCGLHGYKACPKGHFKCAEGINASDVSHLHD